MVYLLIHHLKPWLQKQRFQNAGWGRKFGGTLTTFPLTVVDRANVWFAIIGAVISINTAIDIMLNTILVLIIRVVFIIRYYFTSYLYVMMFVYSMLRQSHYLITRSKFIWQRLQLGHFIYLLDAVFWLGLILTLTVINGFNLSHLLLLSSYTITTCVSCFKTTICTTSLAMGCGTRLEIPLETKVNWWSSNGVLSFLWLDKT